jgi:hypothetical protein
LSKKIGKVEKRFKINRKMSKIDFNFKNQSFKKLLQIEIQFKRLKIQYFNTKKSEKEKSRQNVLCTQRELSFLKTMKSCIMNNNNNIIIVGKTK